MSNTPEIRRQYPSIPEQRLISAPYCKTNIARGRQHSETSHATGPFLKIWYLPKEASGHKCTTPGCLKFAPLFVSLTN